ncbi:hypothetical protein RA307_31270 [Xanthobacteraceae bacterium Astr-EGSB]|uniref:hypothetical protein n=1 Tax=Astrobacterium formosum TaxID=3069710 RepID=UPI0027B39282|nr:hypothetical protein [Xanthobacteraceae bacterium Astr-EGSB]
MSRLWLAQERLQVRLMLAERRGTDDIAVAFNCTRHDVHLLVKGSLWDWTDDELVDLRRMQTTLGYTIAEMAEETGRAAASIRARLKAGLPNLGPAGRPAGNQDLYDRPRSVPAATLAERAARQLAPARDLTGLVLGDPPVGYSALDRIRIAGNHTA